MSEKLSERIKHLKHFEDITDLFYKMSREEFLELVALEKKVEELKEANKMYLDKSFEFTLWLAKRENTDIAARWLVDNGHLEKLLNKEP